MRQTVGEAHRLVPLDPRVTDRHELQGGKLRGREQDHWGTYLLRQVSRDDVVGG